MFILRELLDKTPKRNLNGLCVYDFPFPRRVLGDFSVIGGKNMSIDNCENICQGFFLNCFLLTVTRTT